MKPNNLAPPAIPKTATNWCFYILDYEKAIYNTENNSFVFIGAIEQFSVAFADACSSSTGEIGNNFNK